MKKIRYLKLRNIFNYITLFLLLPFACMLIFLFVYSAHLTTEHSRELLLLAGEDICASVGSSLEGIADGTRSSTYSNSFTYFSNSSDTEKVDKYAAALLEKCKSQLFPYSEVLGVFLYNQPCDTLHAAYNSFNSLSLGQKTAALFAENPSLLENGPLFSQEIDGKPYLFYTLTERYGTLAVMIDPQKETSFSNYNTIYKDTAVFSFSASPIARRSSFSTQLPDIPLYLVCDYHLQFTLSPIQGVLLGIILLMLVLLPNFGNITPKSRPLFRSTSLSPSPGKPLLIPSTSLPTTSPTLCAPLPSAPARS